MIQLEPSPLSDIVLPNFTVLELNGDYEVSFGMELPVIPSNSGSSQIAGFAYEIDVNQGTYALTELDPLDLVPGPVGFSSQGVGNPTLTVGIDNSNEQRMNLSMGAGATGESQYCGRDWFISLLVHTVTYDPIFISLARTTQSASWDSNLCQNRFIMNPVQEVWANPSTIFFDTSWYIVDEEADHSPAFFWLPWTWADVYGYYENEDFLSNDYRTQAQHEIKFTLSANVVYLNTRIYHTGYYSFLLRGVVWKSFHYW